MTDYPNTVRHVPYALIGVLLLCVAALIGVPFFLKNPKAPEIPVHKETATTTLSLVSPLEASAAFVFDVRNSTVLYAHNADLQLPLASITKVLAALVAHEFFPTGTHVTVSKTALAEEGDSGLVEGEVWDVDELLKFILVTSSNDGIALLEEVYNSLGEEKFVQALDRRAREIGLTTFSIRNATGLDASDTLKATNYGSARDVAKLFSYALLSMPDILDATRAGTNSISSLSRVHTIENTNEVIDLVSNAVGGKTGFTDAAGGNLVMSFDRDIGSPIIIVVLGSTKEGRFTDMKNLVDAVRSL